MSLKAASTEPPIFAEEMHFGRRVRCFKARPPHVLAMLHRARDAAPDSEALVDGDRRFTYAGLSETVDSLASALAAEGLAQGDRIAIVMANRWEFIVILLAALRLDAIAVPVNVREQTPELTHILAHSGATFVVYDARAADRLPSPRAIPEVRRWFDVEDKAFAALLACPQAALPEAATDEEATAILLYTSGTTGRPKGARLTHLGLVHAALHYGYGMHLGPGERSVLAVPASHVTGIAAIIMAMLGCGGCTVILRSFSAAGFLDLASSERMTHTVMAPAMYNLCLLRADFRNYSLAPWRIGAYGGAPMPQATIATLAGALPRLRLINAYGATETTSPATLTPYEFAGKRPESVGRAVACAQVRIVDDNGRDVPLGEPGEIWISGPMTIPGYWNDAEATAASFSGPFWKSGDIGIMDGKGFVILRDRKKDMINRGGYNVYSVEIENVVAAVPGIAECAAVAHADPVLGEKIHVFVRCTDEGRVTAAAVRTACAEALADYKVPDFVTFLDGPLPRNANGKVLKAELRALTTG